MGPARIIWQQNVRRFLRQCLQAGSKSALRPLLIALGRYRAQASRRLNIISAETQHAFGASNSRRISQNAGTAAEVDFPGLLALRLLAVEPFQDRVRVVGWGRYRNCQAGSR